MRAVAEARTNIALVKYWGKRQDALNLPAVGSISLTLDGLTTRTEVAFDPDLQADSLVLNDAPASGKVLARVANQLDLVRKEAGVRHHARVTSRNDFPTAAGLASSASAFAALTVAAARAVGLKLEGKKLSELARRGSGSAARSIFSGFVEMARGTAADGSDAVAHHLADWDVRMVIGVTGEGMKATLSTDGMRHTAETSPYYAAWVESHAGDMAAARDAIAKKDLAALGEVSERSCLRMHASALAAKPGILYWSGATVDAFHVVRALRADGVGVWFTNDAGPHVKALCAPADAPRVERALASVNGVVRTLTCAGGAGAVIVEEDK
jgi:diphosphomevalonate decarboxylase